MDPHIVRRSRLKREKSQMHKESGHKMFLAVIKSSAIVLSFLVPLVYTNLSAQDVNTNFDKEHSPDRTANITFSGLYNGINPWTNLAELHRPIPRT